MFPLRTIILKFEEDSRTFTSMTVVKQLAGQPKAGDPQVWQG